MSGRVFTQLYLARHAEVEERYHEVFGGRIDMDVSPRGLRQAELLGEYLSEHAIQAIWASPMKRVRRTMDSALKERVKTPRYLDDLREVDFGAWTGMKWGEVLNQYGVSAFEWLDQLEAGGIDGAEPVPQWRERVGRALRTILDESHGKPVAVFCHGGVIRMILALLLEQELKRMSAFEVDYASVTRVDVERVSGRVVVQWSNHAPWRGRL